MINILVADDIDKEAIVKLKALKFNIVEKHYEESILGEELKKFDDKYTIYRMLLHDLDLTKISVAELFARIEKVYEARLTDEYLTVLNEAISK